MVMNWLLLTWFGGILLFGTGMILSLKYGEQATKWQNIKSIGFAITGEILFWGSIIAAVIMGFVGNWR
jgi:uncharacterized membrane protein